MLTPWGFAYGKLPPLQSSLKPQYNSKNSIKQNQITMADLYLHQSIYIPIGICKREKTRAPSLYCITLTERAMFSRWGWPLWRVIRTEFFWTRSLLDVEETLNWRGTSFSLLTSILLFLEGNEWDPQGSVFFSFFFQTNDREKKIGSMLEYFIRIFHKRRMNINTFYCRVCFRFAFWMRNNIYIYIYI